MLHTFGLRSNRLTSKSLHVILANMSLQNLSHLDLSMNDLRGSAIPKLCQVLSSEDCKLSSLEISDTHLGSAEMKDICKALSGEYNSTNQTSSRIRKNFKSSILELCCSKNNLNLQSCVYLCDFLSKDCCMVSWLDLSWNSLNAAAGEVLSKMLVKNNTIKTFDLSNNSLRDDGGQQIAVSLMTNKHICAINLSVNNIGGRACFVFSQVQCSTTTMLYYMFVVHKYICPPTKPKRTSYFSNVLTDSSTTSLFRGVEPELQSSY